jgi:hypothetical protein
MRSSHGNGLIKNQKSKIVLACLCARAVEAQAARARLSVCSIWARRILIPRIQEVPEDLLTVCGQLNFSA